MKILLVAATEMEIEPFQRNQQGIDILISGVGIPVTIYQLQKKMQQTAYDLVIQAGIAGSFDPSLVNGETVFVGSDCFGDLGIFERQSFEPLFNTALANKNDFPFSEGWLVNPNEFPFLSSMKKVKGITVNTVSEDQHVCNNRRQIFQADIESMEGAALHYCCLMEKIPFLQIRSISNLVGERDKTRWCFTEAIDNLHQKLHFFIAQIQNK